MAYCSSQGFSTTFDKTVETWKQLLEIARLRDITLVYSARDREHNNAVALKDYLDAKL